MEPSRGEHGVEWHGAGAGGGTFRVQLQSPANLWGETPQRFRAAHRGLVATTLGWLALKF